MLVLGGLAPDADAARAKLRAALDSGAAAERFARMVSALGGPGDLLEQPERHLRSEEHTSDLQSLMRSSYAVFCLKKKTQYPMKSIQQTKYAVTETRMQL